MPEVMECLTREYSLYGYTVKLAKPDLCLGSDPAFTTVGQGFTGSCPSVAPL